MEVEEQPTVGPLDDLAEVRRIVQLIRRGMKVTDARLDEERRPDDLLVRTYVGDCSVDGRPCLSRGQQETCVRRSVAGTTAVERQVLTAVLRPEVAGVLPEERDTARIRSALPSNGKAVPVCEERPVDAAQPLCCSLVRKPATGRRVPKRLRLDLDDVDEICNLGPEQIEAVEGNDSDAEVKPSRHTEGETGPTDVDTPTPCVQSEAVQNGAMAEFAVNRRSKGHDGSTELGDPDR